MKNRDFFSVLFALFFIICSCQNSNLGIINPTEGKVEIIILNGTDFEKKISYNKKDVIRKIVSSPDTITIHLSTSFCNEMDEICTLGALFFEMKFYNSDDKLELVLSSFSKFASIRSHVKQKYTIEYDFKKNSYFPTKEIKIALKTKQY